MDHFIFFRFWKNLLISIIYFFLFNLTILPGFCETNIKPVLFIQPFVNLSDSKNDFLVSDITENIITEVQNYQNFIIANLQTFDKTIKELNLKSYDILSSESLQNIGDITGIDFIISGHLIEFNNYFSLNIRILDTLKGEVIITKKFNFIQREQKNIIKIIAEYINDEFIKNKNLFTNMVNLKNGNCKIRLKTIPPGVKVNFNGDFIGSTPLSLLGVKEGTHKVILWLPEKFNIDKLIIDSKPVSVKIKIDNQEFGITPVTLKDLEIGKYNISFITDQKDVKCTVRIESTPEKVPIYWENKFYSRTPLTIENIKQGNYLLEIKEKQLISTQQTIKVIPDSINNFNFKLFKLAELTLNTDQPDVEVFLDDESNGKTPCTLTVSSGEHRITLRKEGFKTINEDIVLKEGEVIKKDFKMQEHLNKDTSIFLIPTGEISDTLNISLLFLDFGKLKSRINENTVNFGGVEITYGFPKIFEFNELQLGIGLSSFFDIFYSGESIFTFQGIGTKFQIFKQSDNFPLSVAIGGYWNIDNSRKNNWVGFLSISRKISLFGFNFSFHIGMQTHGINLNFNWIDFYNFKIGITGFLDWGILNLTEYLPGFLNRNLEDSISPLFGVNLGYSY